MIIYEVPLLTWSVIAHELSKMSENIFIHGFVAVAVLDIVLGTLKAYLTKQMNSSTGVRGLAKNGTAILVVFITYYFLDLAGFGVIATAFIVAGVIQYANSCLENWCQMGFWCPDYIKQFLSKLKDDDGNLIDYSKKLYGKTKNKGDR